MTGDFEDALKSGAFKIKNKIKPKPGEIEEAALLFI